MLRPAMELRDAVGSLVALDDEQRALTNELNRALDALSRAVLPSSRHGIDAETFSSLEERLAFGSDESATLDLLSEQLGSRVVEGAWDLHAGEGLAETDFRQRLGSRVDELRGLLEDLGRLRDLLARRGDVERRLAALKKGLDLDEETTMLLEVVLAARESAAEGAAHDSAAFLGEAQMTALDDGGLAGMAANVRALRETLAGGEDSSQVATDLSRRIVDLAVHFGQDRDDVSRRLTALERDAERRQEISHGLFQAVTKASEVLDLATSLRERLEKEQGLPDGALGPLKAACIEHGVITLLLELRPLRLDRTDLDAAMQELSASLGDLFATIAHQPERVERLGRVWEDLAAVDAGAIEQGWEDSYADVLGVQRGGGGVLSVSSADLTQLAGADGLDPWLDQLVARVDTKLSAVTALVERLEGDDLVLSELIDEDDEARGPAERAKRSLAHFVAEVAQAVHEYYKTVRAQLLEPQSGFRRVQEQVAAFVHAEHVTPDAGMAERNRAFAATLEEVCTLFAELEAQLPAGGDASDWKEAEEQARNQVAGAYRDLAAALARLQRLRTLLFPVLSPACLEALALARDLQDDPAAAMAPLGDATAIADRLGEALEALYVEKLYYEGLSLPPGSEVRAIAGLSRVRSRRLLDLHGATLVLLFRLLTLLSEQYEDLGEDERPGHLSWMEELALHAESELEGHVARLEDCLFELPGNRERLARYLTAFDAYHGWAAGVADSEAGDDLLSKHGRELFTRFERHLAGLGTRVVERSATADTDDWHVSSTVESLIDLYRNVEAELERRPTLSHVDENLAALRERAEELKQRFVDAADAEDEPFDGGHLFR